MASLPHKVTTLRKVKCNTNNSRRLNKVAVGMDASKDVSRRFAVASWAPSAVNAALTAANAAPSAVKRARMGITISTIEDGFKHKPSRFKVLEATWAHFMRNTTHTCTQYTYRHIRTRGRWPQYSSAGLAKANSLNTDITVHGLLELSVSGRQHIRLMVNHILSWERVKGRCGYVYKHWVMISDHLDFLYQEASKKEKKGLDWAGSS